MLTLAGQINDNGFVYFTKEIPYNDEMLSTEFNRPLNLIKLAMNTFVNFKMIEIINSIYHISNWEKYQNIDGLEKIREQNRIRKQKERERKKISNINNNVTSHVTVTQSHAIDIDKERDKEYKESSSCNKYSSNNLDIKSIKENNNNDLLNLIKNYFLEKKYKSNYDLFYKYNLARNTNIDISNYKKYADLWELRERELKPDNSKTDNKLDFVDDYLKMLLKDEEADED